MRPLLLATVLAVSSCTHVAPLAPRFVTVYEQRTALCLIQVLRDTRSTACFVSFRCGRQPTEVVAVASDVCVP